MSQHQGVTEDGKVSVIRNDSLPKRQFLTGIGPVSVRRKYSQGPLERWRDSRVTCEKYLLPFRKAELDKVCMFRLLF